MRVGSCAWVGVVVRYVWPGGFRGGVLIGEGSRLESEGVGGGGGEGSGLESEGCPEGGGAEMGCPDGRMGLAIILMERSKII